MSHTSDIRYICDRYSISTICFNHRHVNAMSRYFSHDNKEDMHLTIQTNPENRCSTSLRLDLEELLPSPSHKHLPPPTFVANVSRGGTWRHSFSLPDSPYRCRSRFLEASSTTSASTLRLSTAGTRLIRDRRATTAVRRIDRKTICECQRG